MRTKLILLLQNYPSCFVHISPNTLALLTKYSKQGKRSAYYSNIKICTLMQGIIHSKYVTKKRHLSLHEVSQVPYNLDLAAC